MSRTCIVCDKRELADHEQQTCVGCINRTRRALIEVERLYALLPVALTIRAGAAAPLDTVRGGDEPIPGGEALILLAGGGTSTTSAKPSALNPDGDRSHAADNLEGDTPSVLAVLASWEDDWRSELGLPAAQDAATVSGCVVFLIRGLAHMAQRHGAFNAFADDMRQLRGTLTEVTKTGYPQDRAAVRCPKCDSNLRKRYADRDADDVPHPKRIRVLVVEGGLERWEWQPDWNTHRRRVMAWNRRRMNLDQGGARDGWECSSRDCDHTLTDAEYHLQVKDKMQAEALPVRDLALLLGVTGSRIRQIIAKHGIEPAGRDGRAPLYRVAEVMRHAQTNSPLAS